jgi:hypothetical protein
MPSSKEIDWTAGLKKGRTWKGSFQAAEDRSTGLRARSQAMPVFRNLG